jgi:hypothetical protein
MASWQLLRKNWFGSRWDLVDETGSRQAEYHSSYFKPHRVVTSEGVYLITAHKWSEGNDGSQSSLRPVRTVQGPDGSRLEWRGGHPARMVGLAVRRLMVSSGSTALYEALWDGKRATINFLGGMGHSFRFGLSIGGVPAAVALCVAHGGPRKIDFVDGLDPMLLHSFCSLTVFL